MILGRVIINGEDISHTIIKAILDVLRDEFFFCERSGGQLASPGPVASRSQQILSSILIRSEFQTVERKKNPLAVLAARLGPHGLGPGFGGFLYPGKPVRLPLNEKTVGPFHTPG